MTKVLEISVTVAMTFNLGDYNSARIEHSQRVEIEDGDDVDEVRSAVAEDIKDFISAQYDDL